MPRRKFSDKQIRDMYEHAAQEKISVLQACRNKGLSNNDYAIVRNWGKKLGLTPLAPAELSGHADRPCQLYALIVHGDKTGIYIGSSADPELRFKQHIQKAKRDGKNGVNKRDRFIYRAFLKNDQPCKIKIFCKKYKATEIAHREPRLIAKVQAAFPDAVHLNGLVGAPMGGYGIKLSDDEIQAVIDDYTENKITTEQLADKYNVGRGTINRILQRAGATKSRAEMMIRYGDTTRQQVIEEVKNGATDDEITAKYGMAKHTIYRLKKEYGLTKTLPEKITNIKVRDTVFPTLNDACDYFGKVDYKTAYRRIKKLKWTAEQALELEPRITPYTKPLKAVTAFGVEYKSMTHASRAFGANPKLVASRVRNSGWTLEDALTTDVLPSSRPKPYRTYVIHGVTYRTLKEIGEAYGIPKVHTVRDMILKNKDKPLEELFNENTKNNAPA